MVSKRTSFVLERAISYTYIPQKSTSTRFWLRTSVLSVMFRNMLISRARRLNYRDTVRNPTTSLRQGKAINLSTSVRTGTRGDVSMDWATTNVSRALPLPHPYLWKLTSGPSSAHAAHPLDRVREQRHRAQVDAGDDGQHRRGVGSRHRLRARTKCPPGSGCCGSRRQARRTWTVSPAFPLYSFIMVDLCVARTRGEVYIDNLSGLCPPSHL